MNQLTPNQRSTFEFQVKKTRDINERNRLCVLFARDDGPGPDHIAHVLRLSRSSVYGYLREFQSKGKTQPDPKGGAAGKLSKLQTKEPVDHLSQYTYRRVKDVCAYVLEQYNISYSTGEMTSWLKHHHFVFKSPVNAPGRLDLEKQAQFIKE